MRNLDWTTLDIGNAENEAWFTVVLFKSNCIILRRYLSIDAKHNYLVLKKPCSKITVSENVYLS